jgi:CheY-like chemotaxis protein
MQSGKITVEKATCDAADLITQAADVMRTMAEEAGVTLSAYPQSTRLWVDPDRILQTLTNLLSNAIKFSPVGGTVWLTVERQGDQVMFQVRDQGRGIPADKLDSIFERFQQADITDAREKGGTGLGLAICRSIVQQHEGRIWVESTLHAGSTFFFTLPTLKEQQPEVPVLISDGAVVPKCDEEEDGQTRTPRVLVVEDDLDLARLLIAMFERHGMVTYYAQTGREALQCTQLVTFDFMVLDPLLPELDGFAVVDWLRQHERLRQVPVIVYSAQDLNAVEQQRLTLGPTRFFTKSRVTPEEFEQQTVQWLDCIMAGRAASNSADNPRAYSQHYC